MIGIRYGAELKCVEIKLIFWIRRNFESKESSGILLTYQKSFDNMLSRFDMKETDESDGNNTDEFEVDFLSR